MKVQIEKIKEGLGESTIVVDVKRVKIKKSKYNGHSYIALSSEKFNEILPVLAFSNQHLDISIHFFKRLLWKQGVYPTPKVREPILPFDIIYQNIADELIQKVLEIESRIKATQKK